MFILDFHYWRFTPQQSRLKPHTLGRRPRGVWVFAVALLVGLGLGLLVLRDGFYEWQYRFQSTETPGKVLDCQENMTNDTRYFAIQIGYEYRAGAQVYAGRENFTTTEQNRCPELLARQTVPIRYLATDPAQAIFFTYRWRYYDQLEIWTARIAALLLCSIGGWGIGRYRQFYRRLRRLNEQGILLPGVITWADTSPENDTTGYQVVFDYLFITPMGYEINASTRGLLRDTRPFGLPRPGLIVSVLYAGDDCFVVL